MRPDSFLGLFRQVCRVLRHSLETKEAMMSENLTVVSSSKFQQRLSLDSNYCTEWWGFKFTVTLLRLTAVLLYGGRQHVQN